MMAPEPLPEDVARALAGAAITRWVQVGGGRNSRVYRVETESGSFALKQYPSRQDDPRDRLGTEVRALDGMRSQGMTAVPRVVAVDRDRNFALLSWVAGELVRTVDAAGIDRSVAFLGQLHTLRDREVFASFDLAAEACLSGAEIERQIRARVAHLRALEGESGLADFLDAEFAPALETALLQARRTLASRGLPFDRTLPCHLRTLVPSDFGFHNALRPVDGSLVFIDFEYFGWDDPVKLTADVLLHPGTPVAKPLKQRFRRMAEDLYGSDGDFACRLEALYRLFGLRWVLILLNEFHPDRWRRRLLAGATEAWSDAKMRQLQAGRRLLADLVGEKGS